MTHTTHHHHHDSSRKRTDSTSRFRDLMRNRAKHKKMAKKILFNSLAIVALLVVALVIAAYFFDK